MTRYYVLTRADLAVIEANNADNLHPLEVRFSTRSGIVSFPRHELLWWRPVDASAPPPFVAAEPLRRPGAGTLPFAVPGFPYAATHMPQRTNDSVFASAAATDALVRAVLPAVPRSWRKATLELTVRFELPESRYVITHRLRNPDTGAELFDFSDALFNAAEVCHRIAAESGQAWNESTLALVLDEHGRCVSRETRYGYGTKFGPR